MQVLWCGHNNKIQQKMFMSWCSHDEKQNGERTLFFVPPMPGQRNVGFTYYKKLYNKLPVELLAENNFHLFFTS